MAQTANAAALLVVAVVTSILLQNAAAKTTYIVGDKTGWTIPPTADYYSTWASVYNFTVGDILFFNFTGRHNVAKVTKDDYDLCNDQSPISIVDTGPANITLDSPGDNFFICTVNEHCAEGQMLAIKVISTTTTTPSSPPPSGALTPPPPTTAGGTTPAPPPPNSAAPSAAAAGATFFVMVMSLVINLC